MGGYSRPKKIQSFNWLLKGGYYKQKEGAFPPAPEAYEPHTVFLLEGRYLSKREAGRVATREYIIKVCREGDFEKVLKTYNSNQAPPDLLEAMDNAYWPWLRKKQKTKKKSASTIDNSQADELNNDTASEDRRTNSERTVTTAATGRVVDPQNTVDTIRAEYLPTLETTPFFRPLVTVTLPSRPLAVSLARLARSLVHGLAYHVFVKKHSQLRPKLAAKATHYLPHLHMPEMDTQLAHVQYNMQLRNLRVSRMVELSIHLAEFVVGVRGGLEGLCTVLARTGRRADTSQLRQEGERQASAADIVTQVGVGAWYDHEAWVREDIERDLRTMLGRYPDIAGNCSAGYSPSPIVTYRLDEHGKRYDSVTNELIPWSLSNPIKMPVCISKHQSMVKQLRMMEDEMKKLGAEGKTSDISGKSIQDLSVKKEELAVRVKDYFEAHLCEFALWKKRHDKQVIYAY
ncbi:hypothetical protein AX15_000332 [Amanita polypyramis BW_CC]|nr:hypothetical protein AX15_000332 [Amanita polypyramis BW_CC]